MGKRIVDICGTAVLFVASLLVLVIIALAIRLDSRGPIFFRQERLGRHGRAFMMCKFRTFYDGPDQRGYLVRSRVDPHVTRVGRVLRRHHLDELPQLWNVLKGDMSLVGPRPLRQCDYETLTDNRCSQKRLAVKPGLTGIVQVRPRDWSFRSGRRQALRLDAFYATHHCLFLDLRILVRTIRPVLMGGGV